MNVRDFVTNKLIPFCFCLRGGKEIWLNPDPNLERLGIESILVEKAHDVIFEPTFDWNKTLEDGSPFLMPEERAHFLDSYVYKLDYKQFGDCTKRWGVIVLPGARVLMTGFSRQRFHLATMLPRNPWKIRREEVILCPQPYPGGTYGDMLNVTLPRLCRILLVLPESEKAKACVALPFGGSEIAHQLVERLGIPRDRHIDSRREVFGLTKSGVAYTVNTPLKVMAGRREYEYMRNRLCPQHVEKGHKRVYIQRQYTRRIIGEAQYLPQLREMGFEIFDDSPRSLDEQMDFFHGAELIAGAHGAGQVNILWANPDVRVLEARDCGLWLNCFRLWSLYNKAPHYLLVDRSRHAEPAWERDSFYEDLAIRPEQFMKALHALIEA